MTLVEKSQSLLILGAVLVGLALGQIPEIAGHAATLILPLLIAMLTGVFLSMPLHSFGKVFQFRSVAIASLTINFLWTPRFAWLLGGLFLMETIQRRL